jgi:uncharacterized membrane protein HdeD (DUF308 family)
MHRAQKAQALAMPDNNKGKTMNESDPTPAIVAGIKENAKMATICGWMLVVAGFLALLAPFVAGVSLTIMMGALLIVGGVGECFLAFKAGAFGRGFTMFLVGLLMVIAGGYLMSQPVAGLASITLILAAWFVAAGAVELFMGLQARPVEGWGWLVFNGIVTLLLGLIMWRQWPLSGAWAVGILFGIKMVFSGWALVFIGRTVKAVAKQSEAESADDTA